MERYCESASEQRGAVGTSISYSFALDTDGNFCTVMTMCTRAGFVASAGVTGNTSFGVGTLCSGSSASMGAFTEGGLGKFDGASYNAGPCWGLVL